MLPLSCYRGHIVSRCPECTLTLGHDSNTQPLEDDACEIVEPLESPHALGLDDNMGKADINIGVLRSILSIRTNDIGNECKRISIFYTFILCKGNICKLVTDGGSSMNVMSNYAVDNLTLILLELLGLIKLFYLSLRDVLFL